MGDRILDCLGIARASRAQPFGANSCSASRSTPPQLLPHLHPLTAQSASTRLSKWQDNNVMLCRYMVFFSVEAFGACHFTVASSAGSPRASFSRIVSNHLPIARRHGLLRPQTPPPLSARSVRSSENTRRGRCRDTMGLSVWRPPTRHRTTCQRPLHSQPVRHALALRIRVRIRILRYAQHRKRAGGAEPQLSGRCCARWVNQPRRMQLYSIAQSDYVPQQTGTADNFLRVWDGRWQDTLLLSREQDHAGGPVSGKRFQEAIERQASTRGEMNHTSSDRVRTLDNVQQA